MAGIVQSCPNQPEDPCARLAREIDELINRDKRQAGNGGRHGLKHRFREQLEGANGPPGSGVGNPAVWSTHDQAIKEQQNGLRDRLNDFNKNNCGNKVPIAEDAWEWATRPAPRPAEWRAPEIPQDGHASIMDSDFAKKVSMATGLTGTALLVYLVVSEGSRLFPPRNLIPVP